MTADEHLDAARRFLADHHRAVLITRRAGGDLQSSPVAVTVDDQGRALVSTREGLAKERNASRDPQVSLCVVSEEWYGPWVHLDGRAEVVRQPDALDLLVDYYRRISGEHPDWDDYRRVMVADRRVVLRISLEHASPVASR
jgi:PPOX class probable F420-dependent enzyme